MTASTNGGYDDGYKAVPCLWGTAPGSLVKSILKSHPASVFKNVLDLGCGEGKNSAPFAVAGCRVIAVDCSDHALSNGARAFPNIPIGWAHSDVQKFYIEPDNYNLIIAYGLFHCLPSQSAISLLVERMKVGTAMGGVHAICTFNDRSHDFRAHPLFTPVLLPHSWFVRLYDRWEILEASDTDLQETHPHNGIEHHHSMTRILARRVHGL